MAAVDFSDLSPSSGAVDFSDLMPQPSYWDKTIGNIQNSYDALKTDTLAHINRDSSGQPSTAGQINALGNGFKFVTQILPGAFVPDSVKAAMAQDIKYSPIFGPFANAVGQIKQTGEQNAPDTTRLIGSLLNIASGIPAAEGMGNAVDYGVNVTKSLPNVAKAAPSMLQALAADDAPATTTKAIPLQSDQLGQVANYLYKNATKSGVQYGPELTNNLSQSVESAKIPAIQGELHATDEAFNNDIDFYNKFAGKTLDIGEVQKLDQQLGRLADSYKNNGAPTDYSNRINGLKYDLRDMAYGQDAPKYLVGGDTDSVGQMLSGNQFWSQRGKALDAEKILSNAALTDNPQASIRGGIRTLLKNDRKMKFYTDDEKQALIAAKKTGSLGFATNVLGNSLVDTAIGSAAGFMGGGPWGALGGAVAGKAVSIPFAKAGEAIQAARLQGALGKMQAELPDVTGATVSQATPSPIRLLPAPQRPIITDVFGNSAPATDEQLASMQATKQGVQEGSLQNTDERASAAKNNTFDSGNFAQALQRSGFTMQEFQALAPDKQEFFLNQFLRPTL